MECRSSKDSIRVLLQERPIIIVEPLSRLLLFHLIWKCIPEVSFNIQMICWFRNFCKHILLPCYTFVLVDYLHSMSLWLNTFDSNVQVAYVFSKLHFLFSSKYLDSVTKSLQRVPWHFIAIFLFSLEEDRPLDILKSVLSLQPPTADWAGQKKKSILAPLIVLFSVP